MSTKQLCAHFRRFGASLLWGSQIDQSEGWDAKGHKHHSRKHADTG
ncbi:MAG TPA: hypothetical protein VG410_10705 [Solirubrobacteraceae bacterium]|jgi:hypothetical protein|nr:hypothetical protein [Solirubrobacteraceae bacterium]